MQRPAALAQKRHYEEIHSDYERHYYDASSMAFRRRFVEEVMFAGLDLNDSHVADLASGSGHNSRSLLARFPKACVTGFDISPSACAAYRVNVGRDCHECYQGPLFNIAMVQGGLHHCVSDLDATLRTVGSMLRPGGILLMWEPNKMCFLETARRLWYRFDHYFEAGTEAALDHDEVLRRAGGLFEAIDVRYLGGPAYFLVLNSLLFRIPTAVKRLMAPPLFAIEGAYNRLPARVLFPCFIARWRRRADGLDKRVA
jgi:SAM-dependent methyltransferase